MKRHIYMALGLALALPVQAQTYAPNDTLKRYPIYENAFDHLLQWPLTTEKFEHKNLFDHFFVQVGAGANMLHSAEGNKPYFQVEAHMGDWVTPVHGWRLGAKAGGVKRGSVDGSRSLFTSVEADWMMSLTSLAAGGFDHKRRFELSTVLGGEAYHAKQNDVSKWVPAAHLGLHGEMRLSDFTALYLEPRVTLVSNKITPAMEAESAVKPFNYLYSLTAGISYRYLPTSYHEHVGYHPENFWDGTFVSMGLWGGAIVENEISGTFDNWGPGGAVSVGKFITPYSALRLKAKVGYFNNATSRKLKMASGQLDYLFNFSGGHLADEKVWLNMLLGVDLAASKLADAEIVPGVGGGLQLNFRTGRASSFYLEPRVDIYKNDFYPGYYSFGNYDVVASLEAGFNFYRNDASNRKAHADADHGAFPFLSSVFVQGGLGLASVATKQVTSNKDFLSPNVYAGVGTWFNPVSGLRLTANASKMGLPATKYKGKLRSNDYKIAEAGVDYLLNLSNYIGGYDADRRWEVMGAIGPRVAMVSGNRSLHPGASAGMQLLYHLNHMMGIFAEPSLQTYKYDVVKGGVQVGSLGFIGKFNVGLNVRTRAFYRPLSGSKVIDEDANTRFAFVLGGLDADINALKTIYQHAKMGFGHRYSPYTAWRVYAEAMQQKSYRSRTAVGADWMLDLTSYAYGYNPDRVVTLSAFVGAGIGEEYRRYKQSFSPDVHVSGQLGVRLGSALQLVAEPEIMMREYHVTGRNSGKDVKLSAHGLLGLVYNYNAARFDADAENPSGWYAEVAAGSGFYGNSKGRYDQKHGFSGVNVEATVGHWFDNVNGLQATLRSHNYRLDGNRNYNINSLLVDYRVNAIRVKSKNADESHTNYDRFKLAFLVGPSFNRTQADYTSQELNLGGHVGMQANVFLSNRVDLVFRPDFNFLSEAGKGKGTVTDFGLAVGVAYKL